MARDLVEQGEFIEVFVDTPIEECIKRDPKGLYARAQEGKIKNFTGIDSPYEAPENAEVVLKTAEGSIDQMAQQLLGRLNDQGVI